MDVSDPELMARMASGDDLALNDLMDRWSERVAAFLYKMTGQRETAVDLAQESFVKLYQARERYRPGGNFSTYLFAIAANLARNHARWKGRHPTVSMDAKLEDGEPAFSELADSNQNPEEAVQSSEKLQAVHEALLGLPMDLRAAMSLFAYQRMSYVEIASVCHCSPKAVETRIYRARQILKDRLSEFLS